MTLRKKISETIKSIKMLKQQGGSVLIISALMLPLMLGCLGFAYDFGNLYMHKSRLQNMTDAAALAGGYAFLESRQKTQSRDTVDNITKVIEDAQINANKLELTYKRNERPIRSKSLHPDADKAADDYIMNNIDNLGTSVTSDVYSHRALNSEGSDPRTFYRVGLYEDVPLPFLSILIGKDKQKVRAGTVVIADDGKGFPVGKSLFDNLFTVGEEGITVKDGVVYDSNKDTSLKPSDDGAAVIQATFDGDIVIATDQNKWNSTNKGDYFYTEAEKNYQLGDEQGQQHSIDDINTNQPNMGGKAVRDKSLTIDNNVSGFLSKLERQHFDLKRNVLKDNTKYNTIVAKNLNNSLRNDVNFLDKHYTITTTTSTSPTNETLATTEIQYYHEDSNKLVFCVPRKEGDYRGKAYEKVKGTTTTYYSLLSEGYNFKYYNDKNVLQDPVTCFTYVVDEGVNHEGGGNQIFCKYNSGNDTWTFYRKIVTISDDSTREVEYRQLYADKKANHHDLQKLPDENGKKSWSYRFPTANDEEFRFTIKTETIENTTSKRVQVNAAQITNSNVFHWENDGWKNDPQNIPLTLEVNGLEGNDYYPLYIILTGNEGTPISIKVTESNDRPIIFCNLTTNEIKFIIGNSEKLVSFKGMIYSPYARVVNAPLGVSTGGGKFKGNIVAKELEIQDSSINWVHQNFLENDSDVNTVLDDAALAQENRKKLAETKAKEYLSAKLAEYAPEQNIDIYDVWNKPEWFSGITDISLKNLIKRLWSEARQQMWEGTGEEAGLDMPDWPWKDGGKPTDTDKHHYNISDSDNSSIGEKVRIINFRTEYTIKPYVDPFTTLRLLD